ncbi:trehalose-6-phosphate synthase [Alsobacter sp. SYSU M60028]|uniref:Trehalose-6-phosphate synthase n=1 Tax=Alsobacter ponti TaxID=2962936 RepID=A0ABT1LB56_9HYPH|nr:trehalose-6-phosphate synthase [Alsobacter ponti]
MLGSLVVAAVFGVLPLALADPDGLPDTRVVRVAGLVATAMGGAALAGLAAVYVMRRWMAAVRQAIDDLRTGRPEARPVALGALGEGVQKALDEFDSLRRRMEAADIDWTPETLTLALANELPGAEIIVVSNREPYIHNRARDGEVSLQIPASGLVSALEPVVRACGGTWVAHGSGTADREAVDSHDRVAVPPDDPSYTLRRVWLSDEEQDGYYYGFANEGLWPLCHIAFVRPVFRESDWAMYRAVNEKFADAVAEEARGEDPIILIQDYHFALLPRLLRQRLPRATIITFWHIPWPNAETFGICPHREEIIEGLLGSSIVGFHTQFHCSNFLDAVDRFVESRIVRETSTVYYGGDMTRVRPYPISIAWPPAALRRQKPVPECRAAVRERLGLPSDIRIAVGIERFDYTKGIIDRMQAVDSFLTEHPEWVGRFALVQVAAPTRSKLASYRALQDEALALAEEINSRHGGEGYRPIVLVAEHHEPNEVYELFRAADLCIVSSLHDGMNLVAKEFVAARDDEQGVLVLSAFAGASRELGEAVIVNPYHTHAMGEAILRALDMPADEQRERMILMREQVRARNVYRWAGQMLLDAARLRKRERIARLNERSETEAAASSDA